MERPAFSFCSIIISINRCLPHILIRIFQGQPQERNCLKAPAFS
jgi:hypothetical protein